MQIEMKILNKEYYNDPKIIKKSGWDKKTEYYPNPKLPAYATPGSAAIDLVATKDYVIYPGEVVSIHTGLAIWIGSYQYKPQLTCFKSLDSKDADRYHGCSEPVSVAAHIIPRSGRGAKEGLVIANTVGLIDEDYQGELIVYALNRKNSEKNNLSYSYLFDDSTADLARKLDEDSKINIKAGERFAQLYFIPIIKPTFKIVQEFSNKTKRGQGGFGSTGV